MGIMIPFPVTKTVQLNGLNEQECDAVHAKAYALMIKGYAIGASVHDDGKFMCVYDFNGMPYFISRENGVCHLRDKREMMLARSESFDSVLVALEMSLSLLQDDGLAKR
jgi:hypothetical protein